MSLTNVEIYFWHGRNQKLADKLTTTFPELEQKEDGTYFFRRVDLNLFADAWQEKFIFYPKASNEFKDLICITDRGSFGTYG